MASPKSRRRRRRGGAARCCLGLAAAFALAVVVGLPALLLRAPPPPPEPKTKSHRIVRRPPPPAAEDAPWLPLPDARRLLSVAHGAWILQKQALPKMTRTMTKDQFNDKLVTKIIHELTKAWPPRVVPGFASALLDTVFNAWAGLPRPPPPASRGGEPPKVAFLFLIGSSMATEPLWKVFFAAPDAKRRSSIYVHPPRGFRFPPDNFFAPHVVAHDDRFDVTWASLAMVHAELVLLAYALRDPRNQRFVLLSETDVPLWPFDCTYSTLLSTELSFLQTKRTGDRLSLFEFKNGTKPTAADWRKGSQWFALARTHAERLADGRALRRWYRAFARKQLGRRKMVSLGDWGQISHVTTKPCFADEHFAQTTLAAADAEADLLPVSLTFATFGQKDEYTVWGDGGERPFRLDAAEWHAVQFGALSLDLMEKLHELCVFDAGATGPGDDDDEIASQRPARTFAGPYRPEKLACAVVDAAEKGARASPCFLFGRKLHSEAVPFYAQLTAEYFVGKGNASLAPMLQRARATLRRDAAAETRHALAGEGAAPHGNYARRNMNAVLAALPGDLLGPLLERQAVRGRR